MRKSMRKSTRKRTEEERHRILVGISLPEQLREEVLSWRAGYENELPVRWVPPEYLHVTVVPPWNEENVEKPIRKMCKMGRSSDGLPGKFTLSFHMVLFGPDQQRPKLIWAEGDCPQELDDLREGLEKMLKRPRSKQTFKLHMTLARFNPADFHLFPVDRLTDMVSWSFTVQSIVLYESHLLPSGAEYEVLHKQEL
jgi:2'-5' RNA ligase